LNSEEAGSMLNRCFRESLKQLSDESSPNGQKNCFYTEKLTATELWGNSKRTVVGDEFLVN